MPVIEDNDLPFRKYIFAESGYTRSVSDGEFKYIAFRYPEKILDDMKDGSLDYAPNYLNTKGIGLPVIPITFYPSYFDADQLFDLESDPYEIQNMAYDPAYETKLAELQAVLKEHLASFAHPFDLEVDEFVRSDQYWSLVAETKKLSVYDIPWYVRDWGEISWPPVQ